VRKFLELTNARHLNSRFDESSTLVYDRDMGMAITDVENFRANVKARCAKHGAIQSLADAAGISRVFLSQILNGHSEPKFGMALDIARALGVDISELYAAPPEGNPPKRNLKKVS
jgi:transcriptional regulator with XRE-family HTH domain